MLVDTTALVFTIHRQIFWQLHGSWGVVERGVPNFGKKTTESSLCNGAEDIAQMTARVA
ncbi:hypothetical protein [Cobetia sp. MB87]|uniref:hypothetical protein n=1 Tax=Cobetia sp. MB87 TaxID=2588451 RepID=UPI00140D1A4A|nr:hypothetical protein [Cobetia sp. MB87]